MNDQGAQQMAQLVEVARLPWGPQLWKSIGAVRLKEGYETLKASLGGKLTQEEFARQVSEESGVPVSLSLMNNWMNGRGLPPETVGRLMLSRVGVLEKVIGPQTAEENISSEDIRAVMGALASSRPFTERHGTDYLTVYDRALAIVKQALTDKRPISTLSTIDVLGYASTHFK